MGLEDAVVGIDDVATTTQPGKKHCKLAMFLRDPEKWGLTPADRDWLAGQLELKRGSGRDGRALSYTHLSAKFAAETQRQGRPSHISPSIMSNHVNGVCICHT